MGWFNFCLLLLFFIFLLVELKIGLHTEVQFPRLPRSGCSMVGDKKTTTKSVELEASLAPAEAEVGAVAKADQ